jgi:hypothetical protein
LAGFQVTFMGWFWVTAEMVAVMDSAGKLVMESIPA